MCEQQEVVFGEWHVRRTSWLETYPDWLNDTNLILRNIVA
jgi:hypothetical protein